MSFQMLIQINNKENIEGLYNCPSVRQILNVMSSVIGQAHTQNDPHIYASLQI